MTTKKIVKYPEELILQEFENYKSTNIFSNRLGRIFLHFISMTLGKSCWCRYTDDWKEAFTFSAYKQLDKNFKKYNSNRGKISNWIRLLIEQGFKISIVQVKNRDKYDNIVAENIKNNDEITFQDHDEYEFNLLKDRLYRIFEVLDINFRNSFRQEVFESFMKNKCDFIKTSMETKVDEEKLLQLIRSLTYGTERRVL